jgi:hypothetical protein
MFAQLEDSMAKGPCRVEDGIPVFDAPIPKGQDRLAFRDDPSVEVHDALI